MCILKTGRALGARLPKKEGQDGKETNPHPCHHGGKQQLCSVPLPKPRVTFKGGGEANPIHGGHRIGSESAVLLDLEGPLSRRQTWVQGATGTKSNSWTTRRMVDLGMRRVPHSFLVIPECPYPFLGRDLFV